ncbi:MAG: hypothetical protein KatS3mg015_2622 [Fimbriimonadales bacterium]|nr:MAG: hypothetical protein KatS3mg015_2622 [Fimbriimonadales bacterium]
MKELPKLVLNRDYVLTTTKGHSIAFKKGEPTHVPASCYQDAIAIGAQPEDGSDPNVLEDQKVNKAPSDPAERNPRILAAIEKIVAGNERKDFTAAGSPTVRAVEREVGFDVDAREVAAMWQEYHEKKAAK